MLWIMDASINISMEPFRAFVGDNLPSEQRTTGFAMQSFLIGTGAVAASILPWLLTNKFGVSNEAPPHVIPDSVRLSFYLRRRGLLRARCSGPCSGRRSTRPRRWPSFPENQARESRRPGAADRGGVSRRNGGRQIRLGGILLARGRALTAWLVRSRRSTRS